MDSYKLHCSVVRLSLNLSFFKCVHLEERILYSAGHNVGFVCGDVFSGENLLTLVNIVLLQIMNQWEKTKLNLQP